MFSGERIHSTVTIVNITVLYLGKLLRQSILKVLRKRIVTRYGNGYLLNLLR